MGVGFDTLIFFVLLINSISSSCVVLFLEVMPIDVLAWKLNRLSTHEKREPHEVV